VVKSENEHLLLPPAAEALAIGTGRRCLIDDVTGEVVVKELATLSRAVACLHRFKRLLGMKPEWVDDRLRFHLPDLRRRTVEVDSLPYITKTGG
jgi:hypothetical protein